MLLNDVCLYFVWNANNGDSLTYNLYDVIDDELHFSNSN